MGDAPPPPRAARDDVEIRPVIDRATLLEHGQAAVETVHVSASIGRYIVELVAATRTNPSVAVGASPRGSLALVKLARSAAVGRSRLRHAGRREAGRRPRRSHTADARAGTLGAAADRVDVVREVLAAVATPPRKTSLRADDPPYVDPVSPATQHWPGSGSSGPWRCGDQSWRRSQRRSRSSPSSAWPPNGSRT